MSNDTDTLKQIADAVARGHRIMESTKRVAEMIRSARGYRWVGLYRVTETEIAAIAWTGTEPPSHPRFPISQGLCGAAVKSRAAVVVGDVRADSRYLTTFASSRSEIVVPILDVTGRVAGLIDAESDRPNAFHGEDAGFLQNCASAIRPMFGLLQRH